MPTQAESINVRISKKTHRRLVDIANRKGQSMQSVLDQVVEEYRRRSFLEGLNEDFENLRRDAGEWEAELDERKAWDTTLADGLEQE